MKTERIYFFIINLCLFFASSAHSFSIDKALCKTTISGAVVKPRHSLEELKKAFAPGILKLSDQHHIITEPLHLQKLARDTLRYLERYENIDKHLTKPDYFETIIPFTQVKETLQFLDTTIEEDKQAERPFRILDPHFIQQNFVCKTWSHKSMPVSTEKIHRKKAKVKLTHYALFHSSGSYKKNRQHPYALYQLITNAQSLPYTKQQILGGILEKGENRKKVRPLVWLSREGLEEALMQGTIFVHMPDSKTKIFRVNTSNNHAYDKTVQHRHDQKRYWYFHEVKTNYANNLLKRYTQRSTLVFAGDIYTFGIGKLIALIYPNRKTNQKEVRLGILADTGGAFVDNLYQLDMFAGIFSTREALKQQMLLFPHLTSAYLLTKRSS